MAVRLSVDRQDVGFDMAFAVACPIAGKIVVAAARVQGLVGRQREQHRLERVIERGAVLALGLALVIALERGGSVNCPHADRPSDHPR